MPILGAREMNQRKETKQTRRQSTKYYQHCKASFLALLVLLLVGVIGCEHHRRAVIVPPCPVPSEAAYSELDEINECCPGVTEYIGRVELLCDSLREMRQGQ
jgi:hypothetical protein